MNELGCVPTKLYLRRQVEGQICPRGHNWLAPALHWGQSDLSERQVESYLLSYLKTLSASSSVLRSSQSPVDLAPCQLSHWTLYCAPCIICSSVLFAVTTCPLAQKTIYCPTTGLLGMQHIFVESSQGPSFPDFTDSFVPSYMCSFSIFS